MRIVVRDSFIGVVCDICGWVSVDQRRFLTNLDDHIKLHVNRDKIRPELRIETRTTDIKKLIGRKSILTLNRIGTWKANKPSIFWQAYCDCGWGNNAHGEGLLQEIKRHAQEHADTDNRVIFLLMDSVSDNMQNKVAIRLF